MDSINMVLLGAYAAAVLTLLITPGPVVMLVSGSAARGGYRCAFVTLLGTNLASLVLIALAVMVLAGMVSLSAYLLNLVGFAGSLFITLNAVRALLIPAESQMTNRGQGGFVQGFMTGIANPKDILFFIAFFPQFIAITRDFTASVALLSAVWVLLDFSVLALYILAVTRWLPVKQHRDFARFSALVLLVIGVAGGAYSLCALADI